MKLKVKTIEDLQVLDPDVFVCPICGSDKSIVVQAYVNPNTSRIITDTDSFMCLNREDHGGRDELLDGFIRRWQFTENIALRNKFETPRVAPANAPRIMTMKPPSSRVQTNKDVIVNIDWSKVDVGLQPLDQSGIIYRSD